VALTESKKTLKDKTLTFELKNLNLQQHAMTTSHYLENINQRYNQGNATEHTFRGDLQQLIEALVPAIRATNEPKRQSCGAPDYILTQKDIPVGFIEAKDIGDRDLEGAKKSGKVYHYDLFGKRDLKYDFLWSNSLKTIPFSELHPTKPNYSFVQKDFEEQKQYEKGFAINELFPVNSIGIVTARDNFTIHDSAKDVKTTIERFLSIDDESARNEFGLGKDVRDWQVRYARTDLISHYPDKGTFCKIAYRPFDDKWTYFTGKSKGFHCYPRNEVMQHFLKGENLGIVSARQ